MNMLILLLALLLQSDPDWQVHEEIAAERMKAAAEFEKVKQFAWARAEYLKVLRLEPDHQEARAKLESSPRTNQGKGAGLSAKREDLLQAIAIKAAQKFRLKAKKLAEEKDGDGARKAWRWVLLYRPTDSEAMSALKLSGKGPGAIDPVLGDGNFPARIAKADAGKEVTELSSIEKRWNSKHSKRATSNLTIEGIGVPADHLPQLMRTAEAVMAFSRAALGNPQAPLEVERFVLIYGEKAYGRYIDDFLDDTPDMKKRQKNTGGLHNARRREFVMWANENDKETLELTVCHKTAECILPAPWVAWLHESAGLMNTQLFLQRLGGSCITLREGTDASSGDWTDARKVDGKLRDKVAAGMDDDYEIILNVSLATISASQMAKAMSVMRFLMLRFPDLFQSVVAAYKEDSKSPKAAMEKGLGFSVEELDEFWRRWYLSK